MWPKDLTRELRFVIINTSPLLVHILSQMNPIHTFPSYLFTVHFNIIIPRAPTSPKCSSPFKFFN
jgi:hypothetical protein